MPKKAPAPASPIQAAFTQDQIDLIKRTIAKGATDDELALFLHQCTRTGLDPFARQIYFIKRTELDRTTKTWIDKGTIQTSIDGFRLIAERSGKYAGQTPAHWCGDDGAWADVWVKSTHPVAARVGVLRSDFHEPVYGVARLSAYAQLTKENNLTRMWDRMGAEMLAKCAEALALRKAFPQELSGLYTGDEMHGAADAPQETPPDVVDAHARIALPPNTVQILSVQHKGTGAVITVVDPDGVAQTYPVPDPQVAALCERFSHDEVPVILSRVRNKETQAVKVKDVSAAEFADPPQAALPSASDDMPF